MMAARGKTWRAGSVMVVIGLSVLDAAPEPEDWIVLRQALPAESGGDSIGRDSVSITADGRFLAFVSRARLLPADTNNARDIYLVDLQTSIITLESVTTEGALSRSDSVHPHLSGGGRFILFESLAMRLAGDANDQHPIPGLYLRDCVEHRTTRVTVGRDGRPFVSMRGEGVISADARFLVIGARSDPFGVAGGSGNGMELYRVARESGTVTRVSVASDGEPTAAADAYDPSLSADGNVVGFIATSPLDPSRPWRSKIPAPFQMSHVYVRDIASGTTTCVGCGVEDAGPYTRTHSPAVSADGRFVTFVADEIKTIGNRPVLMAKIWLYDRASSVTTLVTRSPHGHAPNGPSRQPVISAHGEMIAFESDASNLVCDRRCARGVRDENLLPDIYLFDRVSGTTRRISGDAESQWWDPSVGPSIDGAGRIVAFSSRHPAGSRDIDSDFDLFVWRENVPARRTEQAHGFRNGSSDRVTTLGRGREFGGSLCSRYLCCSV